MKNRLWHLIVGYFLTFLILLFPALSSAASHNIQNSIVKIITTQNHADYRSPWQRVGINSVIGSGVIISGHRILTNAHVVADETLIEVQREGSGITYTADVAFVCHSCDLALLTVDDGSFFKDAVALDIDGLPQLQSRVTVYGFPTGGETISITEGIVSRIEVDYYVHSSQRFLLAQVDAAINPGNSGGPAVSNGKIIGIAMQTLEQAQNIGYIVPAPVIKHFLNDVKDGRYDGFPELDLYVQLMENKTLRKSMNLPKNSGGLLVTGVAQGSNLIKLIKPGDVILDIDGYAIGRDGKVTLKSGLRVESTHLEYLKQVGESLELTLFRNGKISKQKVLLTPRKHRINQKEYDKDPTYYVFAGLVFQPLSNGYISANRSALYYMLSYVPAYTTQGYRKLIPERIKSVRDQIIVLSRVLPDAINQGYKNMEQSVVYSVNGTVVKNMRHLIKLIHSAKGPYLKIITDMGNVIILDVKKARKRNNTIMKKYQVYVDRSPDLRQPG